MRRIVFFLILFAFFAVGCAPKVQVFNDFSEPLKEYTLSGTGEEKVLIIPVSGMISQFPSKGLIRKRPSMVQEIVSHLEQAAKDPQVRAVVLKIESRGGTSTASDILYHEVMEYKSKSKATVVSAVMGLAASGGYYVALSGDLITAHPTSITGSVGTVFMYPKVMGLMEKIGVDVEVSKSGKNKDLASPFRPDTPEEKKFIQEMVNNLNQRFLNVVKERRKLGDDVLEEIARARIYTADQAKAKGLVDHIGYLTDTIARAREMAGIPEDARVVVYRRSTYAQDNIYNTFTMESGKPGKLIDLGIDQYLPHLQTGFYYLWNPEWGESN